MGCTGFQLGAGFVQLSLAFGGLRFTSSNLAGGLVQLVLGGERIHRPLHVRHGFELVERSGYGILLGLVETRVSGVEGHARRAAGRIGQGFFELVGHPLRFRAGDAEVVGHGAVEGGGRPSHGHQDCQPQRDDQPAAAIRKLAQAVEERGHVRTDLWRWSGMMCSRLTPLAG